MYIVIAVWEGSVCKGRLRKTTRYEVLCVENKSVVFIAQDEMTVPMMQQLPRGGKNKAGNMRKE